MAHDDEQALSKKVATLSRHVKVDEATQQELSQRRAQALEQVGKKNTLWNLGFIRAHSQANGGGDGRLAWGMPTAAALASLLVVSVVVVNVYKPTIAPQNETNSMMLADLELLSTGEDFEFYEDYEFYLWLELESSEG